MRKSLEINFTKINTFIESFKERRRTLYQPTQNVAIDERMVRSRHRSEIRQYIKDKPTKWGIKLWVLADSANGYTYDFSVYIGRAQAQETSANGLRYDVVMKLMDPLFDQGYHLYVDNFYSSLTLFKDLFARGTGATGTIMETRRDFPANLKNSKQWAKGKPRGSMRWERDGLCLALQWIDNKVVSLLTTIESANYQTTATRKTYKAFNSLRPNSDLSQTSHCNIKSLSVSEVMRIENMITQVQFYRFLTASPHYLCKKCMETQKENL